MPKTAKWNRKHFDSNKRLFLIYKNFLCFFRFEKLLLSLTKHVVRLQARHRNLDLTHALNLVYPNLGRICAEKKKKKKKKNRQSVFAIFFNIFEKKTFKRSLNTKLVQERGAPCRILHIFLGKFGVHPALPTFTCSNKKDFSSINSSIHFCLCVVYLKLWQKHWLVLLCSSKNDV